MPVRTRVKPPARKKRTRQNRIHLFECLEPRRLLAAPTANDDLVLGSVNTPAVIDFLALNDSDPDGDTLSIASTTTPNQGSLIDHGNGAFTYMPANGFVGLDTFDYTIVDGAGGTDTATVSITISESIDAEAARAGNLPMMWRILYQT